MSLKHNACHTFTASEKKPQPNKISPEQLKNLLKAMDNEEKKVQKKINKNKIKGTPVKNKKDW